MNVCSKHKMAPSKKKVETPWEIAKPLLEEDYLAGDITDEMKPAQIWLLRDKYREVKYLGPNFNRLKESINANKARAVEDADLLQMDLGIYTLAKDKDGCWDGSDAQRLLKDGVKEDKHVGNKPKVFQASREEYKPIKLKVFRDHLTQETRSKRETNCWLVKKKKAQKKRSTPINEDYFLDAIGEVVDVRDDDGSENSSI